MLRRICIVLCFALCTTTSAWAATTLSGNLTTDDAFTAFLSTSDSVEGTLLTSGNSWYTPHAFSVDLTPGTTYYLHVHGWDIYGSISGFLGSFSLTGTDFVFANGTQSLTTNPNDWKVSTTGFGTGYGTPNSYGTNGVAPWGPFSSISDNAQWIWTAPDALGSGYFSTTITLVPEPETYAMMMAGLGLMGMVARRRKAKQQ